jgi:hypothetical protein
MSGLSPESPPSSVHVEGGLDGAKCRVILTTWSIDRLLGHAAGACEHERDAFLQRAGEIRKAGTNWGGIARLLGLDTAHCEWRWENKETVCQDISRREQEQSG